MDSTSRFRITALAEPAYFVDSNDPLSVLVYGCGGTGSHVVSNLARMNYALRQIGHRGITLEAIDPSTVSVSNAGRGLFTTNEIGMNKAEAMVTRMNRLYGSQWIGGDTQKRKSANIIFTCVDTVQARREIGNKIEAFSGGVHSDKPYLWIDTGNDRDTGQVIMGVFENNSISRKNIPTVIHSEPEVANQKNFTVDQESCSLREALFKQDLFINSTVAEKAVHMLWLLLRNGYITYRGVYINNSTGKIQPIKINYEKRSKRGDILQHESYIAEKW